MGSAHERREIPQGLERTLVDAPRCVVPDDEDATIEALDVLETNTNQGEHQYV